MSNEDAGDGRRVHSRASTGPGRTPSASHGLVRALHDNLSRDVTHPSGKTRAGPRVALAALAGATCPAVLALAGAAAVLFAHLHAVHESGFHRSRATFWDAPSLSWRTSSVPECKVDRDESTVCILAVRSRQARALQNRHSQRLTCPVSDSQPSRQAKTHEKRRLPETEPCASCERPGVIDKHHSGGMVGTHL